MPLRALRLLPFPTAPEASFATSLSFASTLQLAAGRAWSRRVTAHQPTNAPRKHALATFAPRHYASKVAKIPSQNRAGPSHSRNGGDEITHQAVVTEVDSRPQNLSRPRVLEGSRPPCRVNPQKKSTEENASKSHSSVSAARGNSVLHPIPAAPSGFEGDQIPERPSKPHLRRRRKNAHTPTSHMAVLSSPQSQDELYSNLYHLIYVRKPATRLPALLDYHDLYPSLQSTRTYNLLIRIALRFRSYGIVTRLLALIRKGSIPKDLETYKLEVRYFVDRGYWKHAWAYVNQLIKDRQFPRDVHGGPDIPYVIWLELCRPPSSLLSRQRIYDNHGDTMGIIYKRFIEGSESLQPRRSLLTTYLPSSMPTLGNSSPYGVYCVVKLLIRTGSQDRAIALIKAYFKAIPRSIHSRTASGCLDIIHLHMISSTAKNGLAKFYDMRKRLFALLKLHPMFKPTSRTLYLLLGPVLRAKYSGTVAWNLLTSFRKNWGDTIEDRRVRRRIIQCALKQGCMDVVSWMSASEEAAGRRRRREERSIGNTKGRHIPTTALQLPPLTEVYSKNGRETHSWFRLRARITRTKTLLGLKRDRKATSPRSQTCA
ncbi:hypothetical protein CPC08DRAFT_702488 [Agrocybe pediades]|nr:hypothetical protein CPC08DRAFT_702488 [Agrocybe pediades]